MIDSPAITTFLDDLITKKHGDDVSAEARAQIKEELTPRLNKWMILQTMSAIGDISPEKLQEFQNLAQGDTPESKILEFVQANIMDTDAFFAKSMLEFSAAYLGAPTN